MNIFLVLAVTIDFLLCKGTLQDPAAVFPAKPGERPIAYAWMDEGLAADGKVVAWSDLKVEPKEGATFVWRTICSDGEPAILRGMLKSDASRFRVTDFAGVSRRDATGAIRLISKKDGVAKLNMRCNGPRSPILRQLKQVTLKADVEGELQTAGETTTIARLGLVVSDIDGSTLFNPLDWAIIDKDFVFALRSLVTDREADYELKGLTAPVTVNLRCEFDDYMRFDLTWMPPIAKMQLKVPMRRQEIVGFFVDTPLAVGDKRTLSFYLQPTPVKAKNRELGTMPLSNIRSWTGHVEKFFEDKWPGRIDTNAMAPFMKQVREGKRVFYYNGSQGVSPMFPWWGWYGDDWNIYNFPGVYAEEVPYRKGIRPYGAWVNGCLGSRSFLDYKIWSVCWYLWNPELGIKDLYWDLATPIKACPSRRHGCEFVDEFGQKRRRTTVFFLRELHKRVYRELKKKNADGAMMAHITTARAAETKKPEIVDGTHGYYFESRKENLIFPVRPNLFGKLF